MSTSLLLPALRRELPRQIMRSTPRSARAASTSASMLQPQQILALPEILPPLTLYRRVLRVHRKALPAEMRVMGDSYVKDEFRRTKSTTNPLQIVGFLTEWQKYLMMLESDVENKTLQFLLDEGAGEAETEELRLKRQKRDEERRKFDTGVLEKLSPEQLGQLYELLQATKEVYVDSETLAKLQAERIAGKEKEEAQGKK